MEQRPWSFLPRGYFLGAVAAWEAGYLSQNLCFSGNKDLQGRSPASNTISVFSQDYSMC